jgi:23S rRNA (uracil1939-C5)-methyltransferase
VKPGDQIEVTIEKMSLHGGGIARHEGLVVFVEYAAPGDRLRVEVAEIKKSHAFARIKEILAPSEERRDAPCPAFGRCGGCNWQHLKEESQWRWKETLVKEALFRAWGAEFPFLPLVQSPRAFRYRNRIQVKKRKSQIGYFEKGSHLLVPIDDCLLAEESIAQAFPDVKRKPSRQETENWEISLTKEGSTQITSLDDRDLAFSQVNRFVNEFLVQEVLGWSEESDWTEFWDLYCGSGNFTFPFAEKFEDKNGLAVELSPVAIEKAQQETVRRGWSPKRLEFLRSDVGLFLKRASPPKGSLVLLDPPRAGLDESVVRALSASDARVILYVSCDPMTLARDLRRFRESGRWKVERARCFDMFPQTDHVETLVELRIDTSTSHVNV